MIRMMTGFESGSTRELDYNNGYTISTAQKYGGVYSLYGESNYACAKGFPALSEFYMQFHLYLNSPGGSSSFTFQIRKASTILAKMVLTQAGLMIPTFYVGDATVIGTGPRPIATNRWVLIELHLKIADSGGIFEVLIDQLDYFSFVGYTKAGSDTTADMLYFTNWFLGHWIDNIVINDITGGMNDLYPAGLKIVQLKPTGNGDKSQWTPSAAANHYTLVDEAPPSETDYVSTNTEGVIDLFTMEDLPEEAKYVAAVKTELWAWKTGVPTPTGVAGVVKSGGQEHNSELLPLPTYVTPIFAIWEVNPATGQLWTIDQVNDMQAGVVALPTTTSTTSTTTTSTTTTTTL